MASGLANARRLLDRVKSGEAYYDFIEIMACPGGFINGGGQPLLSAEVRSFERVVERRMVALYAQDYRMPLRKSHENPCVKVIYKEFLEKPGSHKAHEVLHTTYVPVQRYRT